MMTVAVIVAVVSAALLLLAGFQLGVARGAGERAALRERVGRGDDMRAMRGPLLERDRDDEQLRATMHELLGP